MTGGEDSYTETPLQLASAAGRYTAGVPNGPWALPPLPAASLSLAQVPGVSLETPPPEALGVPLPQSSTFL